MKYEKKSRISSTMIMLVNSSEKTELTVSLT